MHLRNLHQINAGNTHVAENLHEHSLPALEYQLEKIILVLEQYLKLDPRSETTTLSNTILTIILSAHHLS